MDGLWAITDIIPRTNHKPTVRRLVVPGHELDERRKRDHQQQTDQMHGLQNMMMMMNMPTRQQISHRRKSMPIVRGGDSYYWHH